LNSQNFWELIAGIGIFLFGMHLLEESIRLLSGVALKRFIKNYTDKKLKAITTGALATAILQSSSAVTLMVLAFAGAGIMQMNNAIGVILGANIGTTFTSWIVALAGFKFSIEALALPIIAIGGLGLIFFGKSKKSVNYSKLLVGFGFLFMGLDYMKRAVEEASAQFSLETFQDANILIFVLIGFVLTAVVQSSSAAIAIVLSGISSGLIDFQFGAAMVIGSNLGTTVTVLVGSIGGNIIKKRIAWSHVLFNCITGLFAIFLIPFFSYLINDIFNLANDPVSGLALFHTLFNVSGVLLFIPFLNLFVIFIVKIVPEKEKNILHFIHLASSTVPEAAIVALQNEVHRLVHLSMYFNLKILGNRGDLFHQLKTENAILMSSDELYDEMKGIQEGTFSFSAEMQHQDIPLEISEDFNRILHAARYALISAKSLKDVKTHIEDISTSDNAFCRVLYQRLLTSIENVYNQLSKMDIQNVSDEIIDELYQLNREWKESDNSFAFEVMQQLKNNTIEQKEVSELLSLQRGFTQSVRQTIAAHKDLLLSKHQADKLESL